MVVKQKNTFIRQVKDITLSSTLMMGLLTASPLLQGCRSGSNDTHEEVYTKGVQTFIKETDWGEFKITDEKVVGEGESQAIVTYLDGRIDTLSVEEAKRITGALNERTASRDTAQTQGHSYGHGYGHHFGLGNALLYGSMGYMLGRSMQQPTSPDVYANSSVYQRARENTGIVRNSRVSRPVGSNRGFFRSGSRGVSS